MKLVEVAEKIPIYLWLGDIEEGALAQARNLANLPFAFRHIAIMPDAHEGYGMPIGGVMATQGVIVPNAVGVDIGCGMMAVKTSLKDIDEQTLKTIMGEIRKVIPVGFHHHRDLRKWEGFDRAPDIKIIQDELQSARHQLGTLGGGNHFIEIQRGDDGYIWIMIHSGSRNFGFKTAGVYNEKAKELCERWHSDIPHRDLSFLPMDDPMGREYFSAMNFCLDFAQANRAEIMGWIVHIFHEQTDALLSYQESVNIHHNYAAVEHHFGMDVMVHRKGATRARAGQIGIIPGSMGTSSFITEGLGNLDSFMSSSHGAGRRMGRKEAIRTLSLEAEQAKMVGIVHGLRGQDDLEEAPGAYKDIDVVMENQRDLVRIVCRLSPLASIKG